VAHVSTIKTQPVYNLWYSELFFQEVGTLISCLIGTRNLLGIDMMETISIKSPRHLFSANVASHSWRLSANLKVGTGSFNPWPGATVLADIAD
jgi:hypothetical protein